MTPPKEFFSESDCDVVASVSAEGRLLWPPGIPPSTVLMGTVKAISLFRANQLIRERSRVVYGSLDKHGELVWVSQSRSPEDTHSMLALNIEPIEQDSAESLLRELLQIEEEFQRGLIRGGPELGIPAVLERARKLLERKDGV